MHEHPEAGAGELRVRLAADPASVPGARRFVSDGLESWGLADLAEDAALCVSELAGNAALHSAGSFMHVAMLPVGGAVRISVEDDGDTPTEAIRPRPILDPAVARDSVRLEDEATTGRGLAIVSILAVAWGVEATVDGKRIWAEIDGSLTEHRVRPPHTTGDPGPGRTGRPGSGPGALPSNWGLVRLLGCPVRLSLRQDDHLDELIRELQLLSGAQAEAQSQALAAQLRGLLSGPAHARHTGRRIAEEAARAGKDRIDVEMAMPREYGIQVREPCARG